MVMEVGRLVRGVDWGRSWGVGTRGLGVRRRIRGTWEPCKGVDEILSADVRCGLSMNGKSYIDKLWDS